MHRSHLALCAVGVATAVGYVALTGGSPDGIALVIAATLCPLLMIFGLTVLMGHGGEHLRGAPKRSDSAGGTDAR